MGWVIHRHGGALRARVRAGTSPSRRSSRPSWRSSSERYDPKRERCWIAERDGRDRRLRLPRQAESKTVAQLRLLLVEPKARGLGIGARLVSECMRFAPAGRLPEDHALDQQRPASRPGTSTRRPGFGWSPRKPHRSFGHDLVGETWELALVTLWPGARCGGHRHPGRRGHGRDALRHRPDRPGLARAVPLPRRVLLPAPPPPPVAPRA